MNGSSQHRLVVLGSMDEFIDLVKTAKKRGYYVIVCDGYADGPAKAFADKAYTIDVRDTDAVAEMCTAEQVDGIIASFSDLLAECLVSIAKKAGLKHYCEPERLKYLREKPLMKEMFAELGVPTAKAVTVHRDSIEEDLANVGFPCVVKPVNGYGSRGVYILDNAEEVKVRFDEIISYSDHDYIIAEELNSGHEINMMSWVLDGEPIVLDAADREKSIEIAHEVPHVSRIVYPSCFSDRFLDDARDILRKVAAYVGIQTGPLSMQFFYSEDEGIKVCEIAGRLFGYEHELLELASGFSIEDLLLDYVYDEAAMRKRLEEHSLGFEKCSAGLYFHGYEDEIAHIEGAEDAAQIPEVKEVLEYYKVGETIKHGVGAKPYVIRYYLCADNRGRIDELTNQLFESTHALSPAGKDILYHNEIGDYSDLS